MKSTRSFTIAALAVAMLGLSIPAQVDAEGVVSESGVPSEFAGTVAASSPAVSTAAIPAQVDAIPAQVDGEGAVSESGVPDMATGSAAKTAASAMDGERAFEAGNRAYAAGRFKEAIVFYERALAALGPGAGLHFNLGNAYARVGQVGPAVLHYERALVLRPEDQDVAANLARVRKEAGLYEEPLPTWERWARAQSLDGWTLWGIAALSLLGLVMFGKGVRLRSRAARSGRSPRTWLPLPVVAVVLGVVMLVAAAGVIVQLGDLDRAVVVAGDARLRVSPFAAAQAASSLQTGRVVEVVKTHGDFRYVRDHTGRTGWIPGDQVALIRPEGS